MEAPIHEELGWNFTRFGHKASESLYAAFLRNEDGSLWQAVISLWDSERSGPYRYLAPTNNGDRAFLPPIPPIIRKRIALNYGIDVPETGSFWEWCTSIDVPRIITEGGKKGLCALSLGYITIALYGCTCGAINKDKDVEECIVFDETAFTQVGKNKDEWKDKDYNPYVSTLFGSYHHYCRGAGHAAKGLNNFAPDARRLMPKSVRLQICPSSP